MEPLQGEQLTFLERVVRLVKRESMWVIFKALFVIALFVFIMYNGVHSCNSNVSNIVEYSLNEHLKKNKETHEVALKMRKDIRPQIDSVMHSVLHKLDADRVFVLEMHNGTNNTAGLPFIYGEMTYEVVADSIVNIDEDYTNLNLSRFSFPEYLESYYFWAGSIEKLETIDTKLAKRMASNDVSYFAIARLQGVKNELGYFGVSYCFNHEPKSYKIINAVMLPSVQVLSTLLDMGKTEVNDDE